ncbi:hypothetical protein VDGD_10471 [Verticillium dahliae]|nr:hypothetical protein VDGD_10471 [Verticillium dahliae]
MKLSSITLVAAQLLAVVALPTSHDRGSALVSRGGRTADAGEAGAGAETGASEPAAGGEAGGENKANEVEQQAQFDTPIAVGGDDIKTDTLYPPGVNGVFEVELQGPVGRTLTVTENKSPAAPPIGFIAVEPVSWIISLAEGTDGLTLQKVDYILNANSQFNLHLPTAQRN